MPETEIFLTARPAFPWNEYPYGPFALAAFAALLVLLTARAYAGQPQVTGRRFLLVLCLRLAALAIALVAAVRPQVGFQQDPKVPSTLIIGIDISESMTVRDEVNAQTRIDAVRKVLGRCEPILDELRGEQNVTVKVYGFGPADFREETGDYDPAAPVDAQQSDYGAYLTRTLEKWQGEGVIRGHLVIGDGRDNGTGPPALPAAERWRLAGGLVHTFVTGSTTDISDARDVAITDVTADPSPVPVKTDYTLIVRVNALGFPRARVPVKVQTDEGEGYRDAAGDTFTLTEERDNELRIPMRAPDKPGEIKVRVSIPTDSVPGDVAPANNELETYLTVTKEGMRILFVDRITPEHGPVARSLLPARRPDSAGPDPANQFALVQVFRQPGQPATVAERDLFDFDKHQYDVLIIGNVSARQLTAIDPNIPAAIADQVTRRGMGLLFTGGHAAYLGTPGYDGEDATGWLGVRPIEDILPVDLSRPGRYPDTMFPKQGKPYQYLPTLQQAGHYLNRLADGPDAANLEIWARLNAPENKSRFNGLSRMGAPKPTATVYAVASDERGTAPLPADPATAARLPPVLVGHQIGEGNRGRVLALAAHNTFLWQRLGQPKSDDGKQLFARFWRGMVRWLAHQDEDEGAAFARPARRRVPLRAEQTIEVGLRAPGGVPATDPSFEVKVIGPGETEPTARPRPVFPAGNGRYTLPYVPSQPGEYTVKVSAAGTDPEGKPVTGEATARFLSYPESSEEMLLTAADPEFMRMLANAGGGRAFRLEELPNFLRELKSQKPELARPKPRYLPDWRRNHSGGFLTAWLLVFVALLGTEWGLRRAWGMV